MNTPAHLLLGAALFGAPDRRRTTGAALIGALMPDLSLYLMAGVSLILLQIPPQVVFDELYFSDGWQTVFAIDNSFLVWGLLLGVFVWRGSAVGVAFAGAAFLHLLLDFPLHHDDGRPHFWPLTSWVFESPVSYWDSRRGAAFIAPVEGLLCLAALVALWRRYRSWAGRLGFSVLFLLELWVIRQWLLFF